MLTVFPRPIAAIGLVALSGLAAAQQASPAADAPAASPPAAIAPEAPVPAPAVPPSAPAPLPTLTAAQAGQIRKMLEDAASHGIATGAAAAAAADGPALVEAALAHARALHGGRLREDDFEHDWGMRPTAYDPLPGFAAAVAADRLSAWIASLPPPYAGYDALRRGLAAYRVIEAKGGWESIGEGPALNVGSKDARVAALRRRLAIEDIAVAGERAGYDVALAEAVRRAQKRYGLEPTGIANQATIAALNVPVTRRIDQIVANMERWRWLPRQLPRHRIQVNIAAAVLTVFEADAPVTSMRAVTGRPGDETPMLRSDIHSIVINPPWNVPTSIATKELWPKERKNPGYLRRSGFKVIKTPDGGTRLQQAAGAQSALGRIKFDFDNRYAVYLHDTPTRGTFDRYSRLASHGCVRLQRPVDLAKLVLKEDPRWAGDAIDEAIAAGTTMRAKLPEPVAILLLYWTAFGGANGQMGFRGDPYGWDTMLASKLAGAAQVRTAAK